MATNGQRGESFNRLTECSVEKRYKSGNDSLNNRAKGDCNSHRVDQDLDEAIDQDNQGKENQQQPQKDRYPDRFCFACNKSLDKSRQFINIDGQIHRWHPECFRCNICKLPLDRETSCHLYKDEVVCREDYAKLRQENSVKCSRCRWTISASDWVRRAGRFVYHLACFSCDICLRQLSTGEQFTLSNQGKSGSGVRLLCRLHFAIEQPSSDPPLDRSASIASAALADKVDTSSPVPYDFSYARAVASNQSQQYLHLLASTSATTDYHHRSELSEELATRANGNELGDDTESLNGNLVQQTNGTSVSSSSGSTSGALNSMPSKSKRVRTTFTEDQLSILQTHFQIDSNPDGQDLERIATITGLSKRVTQVWFQNSRARQKKYLIKRKPSSSSTSIPITASITSATIGFTGTADLRAHFAAGEPHQGNVIGMTLDGQHSVVEEMNANCQQKWSTNMSDRSDLSTTDGCAALEDDLDEDSRCDSEDRLMASDDSGD